MYKDERGIVSEVSNEGGSVGKLVISSKRLDWVRRVADLVDPDGWMADGTSALARRVCLGALGPDSRVDGRT